MKQHKFSFIVLLGVIATVAVTNPPNYACEFPPIASCITGDGNISIDGTPCAGPTGIWGVFHVDGDSCTAGAITSCNGRDSRCGNPGELCNVLAVHELNACRVYCYTGSAGGKPRINPTTHRFVGWCADSAIFRSVAVNETCDGGPCHEDEPAYEAPPGEPVVPPSGGSSGIWSVSPVWAGAGGNAPN